MLFIVWGWKVIFRTVGNGVFSCPSCGADRNFERRRAQRWFTLFWIPLIPLKVVGEVIRCTYCNTDFRDTVLARPTTGQFTDLLQNSVRGVMVNVLRRGGGQNAAAREIAIAEITQAGTVGYTQAHLEADFQAVPEDLSPLLAPLAMQLPQSGKEALIAGAARAAAADGPIQPAERQVIDMVGAALGMTAAHVAGVVGMAAGPAAEPAAIAPAPVPAPSPWGQPAASAADAPTTAVPMAAAPAPAAPSAEGAPTDSASMPTQAIRIPQQQTPSSN